MLIIMIIMLLLRLDLSFRTIIDSSVVMDTASHILSEIMGSFVSYTCLVVSAWSAVCHGIFSTCIKEYGKSLEFILNVPFASTVCCKGSN